MVLLKPNQEIIEIGTLAYNFNNKSYGDNYQKMITLMHNETMNYLQNNTFFFDKREESSGIFICYSALTFENILLQYRTWNKYDGKNFNPTEAEIVLNSFNDVEKLTKLKNCLVKRIQDTTIELLNTQ